MLQIAKVDEPGKLVDKAKKYIEELMKDSKN